MKRFRFSVNRLLLATSVVALLMGGVAYRNRIYREINDLKALGVNFGFRGVWDANENPNKTTWLVTPNYAEIHVFYESGIGYQFTEAYHSRDKAIEVGKTLEERIRKLGIENVEFVLVNYGPTGWVGEQRLFTFGNMPLPE
jgi:hypothetical protein